MFLFEDRSLVMSVPPFCCLEIMFTHTERAFCSCGLFSSVRILEFLLLTMSVPGVDFTWFPVSAQRDFLSRDHVCRFWHPLVQAHSHKLTFEETAWLMCKLYLQIPRLLSQGLPEPWLGSEYLVPLWFFSFPPSDLVVFFVMFMECHEVSEAPREGLCHGSHFRFFFIDVVDLQCCVNFCCTKNDSVIHILIHIYFFIFM